MANVINATSTGNGGLVSTGDDSGILNIQTNETNAVTIDASQNVGIGVTPSAWGGTYKAEQLGAKAAFSYTSLGNGYTLLTHNAYDSGAGAWKYIANGYASQYTQVDGTHQWTTSASGTAGNAITFTESMRITSSGELFVNTTTNSGSPGKITVLTASGDSSRGVTIGISTSSYRNIYMFSDTVLYFNNGSNQASLSAAGAWTNASDARLKKNIVDIKYGLADVLKAQPRSYQMNAVSGDFVGFVAQELQEVIPEVVSGDPEVQLGVDYGSLVAVAFKAIQELKAINDTQAETINALTARIVALEQA